MNRLNQMENFLKKQAIKDFKIEKIAGDASFRHYYRVFRNDSSNLILMEAPPKLEDIKPFIQIDQILRHHGFLAPEILAQDHENGFLLLQDFGDISYTKALQNLANQELQEKELNLYKKSCDVLVNLHKISITDDLPLYDHKLLMREVMLFIEWYLPHIAKKPATEKQIALFQKLFSQLFEKLSNDRILVLRDYHADNLFVVNEDVGLIDFQDAVLGSKAYDMVSLLEDARREVSGDTVEKIIDYYLEKSDCDKEQFLTDYKILSLQRNVKIIGIFSRLAIRDNKPQYLKLLPKMINYVTLRLEDDLFSEIKDLFNNFAI